MANYLTRISVETPKQFTSDLANRRKEEAPWGEEGYSRWVLSWS